MERSYFHHPYCWLEMYPNMLFAKTKWKGPEINYNNWKKILTDHIAKIDWERVLDDVSPFLEREGDVSLLTLENCKRLIGEFKPVST